jgi:hypothetical protein
MAGLFTELTLQRFRTALSQPLLKGLAVLACIAFSSSRGFCQPPPASANIAVRDVEIFWGIDNDKNRWSQLFSRSEYHQWDYLRSTADGFYLNFVNMYTNNADATTKVPWTEISRALTHKNCFYETTMESSVAGQKNLAEVAPNMWVNSQYDRQCIAELKKARFRVPYASLNYVATPGIVNGNGETVAQRFANLQRQGAKALTLVGPWAVNGDLSSDYTSPDGTKNRDLCKLIRKSDGVATDGPASQWKNSSMAPGSVSTVRYCRASQTLGLAKKSAIMICPGNFENSNDYVPLRDFQAIGINMIRAHEESKATPDLWTFWAYNTGSDFPIFPEKQADESPANTLTGFGYYLVKHFKELPAVLLAKGNHPRVSASLSENDMRYTFRPTSKFIACNMGVQLSVRTKSVDLCPLVCATVEGNIADWNVKFYAFNPGSSKYFDVTTNITKAGGLNCIGELRVLDGRPTKIIVKIALRAEAPTITEPLTVKVMVASHISQTRDMPVVATVTANTAP